MYKFGQIDWLGEHGETINRSFRLCDTILWRETKLFWVTETCLSECLYRQDELFTRSSVRSVSNSVRLFECSRNVSPWSWPTYHMKAYVIANSCCVKYSLISCKIKDPVRWMHFFNLPNPSGRAWPWGNNASEVYRVLASLNEINRQVAIFCDIASCSPYVNRRA
jgi:hypothetical protein